MTIGNKNIHFLWYLLLVNLCLLIDINKFIVIYTSAMRKNLCQKINPLYKIRGSLNLNFKISIFICTKPQYLYRRKHYTIQRTKHIFHESYRMNKTQDYGVKTYKQVPHRTFVFVLIIISSM